MILANSQRFHGIYQYVRRRRTGSKPTAARRKLFIGLGIVAAWLFWPLTVVASQREAPLLQVPGKPSRAMPYTDALIRKDYQGAYKDGLPDRVSLELQIHKEALRAV